MGSIRRRKSGSFKEQQLTLRNEIVQLSRKNFQSQNYISERDLYNLLKPEVVKNWLEQYWESNRRILGGIFALGLKEPACVDYISKHLRKTLAILIISGNEEAIYGFYDQKIRDEDLPIPKEMLRHVKKLNIITFCNKQHDFPPMITQHMRGLDSNVVLPITDWKDEEVEHKGLQGEVCQITLDPDYDGLHNDPTLPGVVLDKHVYAIKFIKDGEDGDTSEAEKEIIALKFLRERTPNIVPLLTNFRYKQGSCLVLPWADEDLHSFMETSEQPATSEEVHKLLEGISGVSSCLRALHFPDEDTRAGQGDGKQVESFLRGLNGVHRDLCLQNILRLGELFMISDFGLVSVEDNGNGPRRGQRSSAIGIRSTSSYSAPKRPLGKEDDPNLDLADDVWALGCIFLEVLSFALCGYARGYRELLDLRRATIVTASGRRVSDFPFHDGTRLKPQIRDWIHQLRDKYARSDPIVYHFIKIVKKMLRTGRDAPPDPAQFSMIDVDEAFKALFASTRQRSRPQSTLVEVGRTANALLIQESSYAVSHASNWPTHDESPGSSGSHTPSAPSDETKSTVKPIMTPRTPAFTRPPQRSMSQVSAQQTYALRSPPRPPIPGGQRSVYDHTRSPSSDHGMWSAGTGPRRQVHQRRTSNHTPPPDIVRSLKHLEKADTVFIVDDHFTMKNEWPQVREALETLATAAIKDAPTKALEVHFFETDEIISTTSVQKLLEKFDELIEEPSGNALLHELLDELLSGHIRGYSEAVARDRQSTPSGARRNGESKKYPKLNLIILTNGSSLEDEAVGKELGGIIQRHAQKLEDIYAPRALAGLQFVQIGGSERVTSVLEWLDNDLMECYQLKRDMVDTQMWPMDRTPTDEEVYKIMTGALVRSVDGLS